MQVVGHWVAPLPGHVPSLTAGAATQTQPMQLLHAAGIGGFLSSCMPSKANRDSHPSTTQTIDAHTEHNNTYSKE